MNPFDGNWKGVFWVLLIFILLIVGFAFIVFGAEVNVLDELAEKSAELADFGY